MTISFLFSFSFSFSFLFSLIVVLLFIFIFIFFIAMIIDTIHILIMKTIFMNTENSKTNEPHRFKLDLADKLNLKNPKKNIALI